MPLCSTFWGVFWKLNLGLHVSTLPTEPSPQPQVLASVRSLQSGVTVAGLSAYLRSHRQISKVQDGQLDETLYHIYIYNFLKN